MGQSPPDQKPTPEKAPPPESPDEKIIPVEEPPRDPADDKGPFRVIRPDVYPGPSGPL